MTAAEDAFDLNAYLRRIGHDGPREPTPRLLEALHLAHALTIPFENLDVRLGRPIRLDVANLQAKLVAGRRGGYCFEQNTLFAAALEALGFQVTRLAARVRFGATRLLPRTHMLLRVDIGGQSYLADVGFGGDGLLGPVPLTPGQVVRQGLWTYRLVEEAGLLVLQSRRGGWFDLYAFSLEPQHPIDFEVANHYTATHPESIFVRSLTVQRPSLQERHVLRNRDYLVESATGTNSRHVADDEEMRRLLAETFGLDLPAELLVAVLRDLRPLPGGAAADRAADS
jgi:N-hydroxyarylamine O-acetyltransferase